MNRYRPDHHGPHGRMRGKHRPATRGAFGASGRLGPVGRPPVGPVPKEPIYPPQRRPHGWSPWFDPGKEPIA